MKSHVALSSLSLLWVRVFLAFGSTITEKIDMAHKNIVHESCLMHEDLHTRLCLAPYTITEKNKGVLGRMYSLTSKNSIELSSILIRPCLNIPWLLHAQETNSYILALWLHVQFVATHKGLKKTDTAFSGELYNIFNLSIVFGKPTVHGIKM